MNKYEVHIFHNTIKNHNSQQKASKVFFPIHGITPSSHPSDLGMGIPKSTEETPMAYGYFFKIGYHTWMVTEICGPPVVQVHKLIQR